MLSITHYQRNANQNYNEVPLHTSQNGHHLKVYNNKCWRQYEKRELSYSVGGNENWCSHYGEHYKGSLKSRNNYHIIWQFQSWVYNQRIESRPQKDICIPIFITALFATQVSISRTPTCGPSMQQNILQLKRKKKEILHYGTTWMNLEAIILSEISQSQKCKYYIILLI